MNLKTDETLVEEILEELLVENEVSAGAMTALGTQNDKEDQRNIEE